MRIYFAGIGGVGIGPLAEIASDAGYDVVGSDLHESLMARELMERGVTIRYDQSGEFLRATNAEAPIDWFVYTSALPPDHPELTLARELGIRTAKRDELLAHIIGEKNLKLIAIAGTHGKTTTTGMMVWALQQLGVAVSYSIGTTLSWGPSGHFDPKSEYFVYECDEFDRNFLHFHPYLSLITSIEHDHIDTYPTTDDYTEAFTQFAAQSQQVITWRGETTAISLPENTWVLSDEEIQAIKLPGMHNRRNATLVAKGIEYLGSEEKDGSGTSDIVKEILASFPGTNRRFEKLATGLYTDYGHHPSEIQATLQMASEISDHVVLVYQPHQNVRQHDVRDLYTDEVFAHASELYWLPTYLSREKADLTVLTPEELTQNLHSSDLHLADLDDTLWHDIETHRDAGHLVLCMGAGTIDSWVRERLT